MFCSTGIIGAPWWVYLIKLWTIYIKYTILRNIITQSLGYYLLPIREPLTEMCTRSISWGKGGRLVRLTTLPPSCTIVMKSGNLNFLEHSGLLQACNGADLPWERPSSDLYIVKNLVRSHTKNSHVYVNIWNILWGFSILCLTTDVSIKVM